jgi:hypothetical protein
MATQLVLLERSPDWKLDPHTREVGRKGIAEARAALRRASSAAPTSPGQRRSHAA